MQSYELEKTYLAKYLPENISNYEIKEIIDIYIPKAAEVPKLRIRQNGNTFEITKKTLRNENDGSSQIEQTIELSQEEFEVLSKVESKKVHKIRYYMPYKDLTAEIDVFEGELKGLVLVEFEFNSRQSYEQFEMPEFCLADVTQEIFISGKKLSGKSYDDIEGDLERFGYMKIA